MARFLPSRACILSSPPSPHEAQLPQRRTSVGPCQAAILLTEWAAPRCFRSISRSGFLSGRLKPSPFLSITQIRHKPLSKVHLPVAGDPQVDTGFEGGTRPGGQGMRGSNV